MKRFLAKAVLIGATAALIAQLPAAAVITGTTGAVVKIAPPASVEFEALTSDTEIFAFDEQQGVTLPANLAVDITQPGTYDDTGDLTPGSIAGGTVVNSHMLHADNVGSGGGPIKISGTATFDSDILGIAVHSGNLDASDFLGAPGTIYPTGKFQRDLELDNQNDVVIWQVDNRTVFFQANTIAHVDQIRVVTEKEEPPPGGGQGCTPGFWKQSQHFDSWVGFAPTDSFEAVFGRDAYSGSPTLLEALSTGGGGLNALGRHATAALLNASSGGVSFAFTTADVIAMYQAAFDAGGDAVEDTKNIFAAENEMGCPLN
jgi:hypothetical protein